MGSMGSRVAIGQEEEEDFCWVCFVWHLMYFELCDVNVLSSQK